MKTNPPWSDRILRSHKAEIQSAGLPMPVAAELGSGHYGAVYPTEDDSIVFKVTSDPSEVKFIKAAMEIGEWPEGIVKYHAVIDFESSFRRRKTYGIWREAATKVGLPTFYSGYGRTLDWDQRTLKEFGDMLGHFKENAALARDTINRAKDPSGIYSYAKKRIEDWAWGEMDLDGAMPKTPYGSGRPLYLAQRYVGGDRVAMALRACAIVAEYMENSPKSDLVGSALSFYLDADILLADVHGNNVGLVDREGYEQWVITDPGHAVFLTEYE